jgi:hypothetical protein
MYEVLVPLIKLGTKYLIPNEVPEVLNILFKYTILIRFKMYDAGKLDFICHKVFFKNTCAHGRLSRAKWTIFLKCLHAWHSSTALFIHSAHVRWGAAVLLVQLYFYSFVLDYVITAVACMYTIL